MVRKILNIEINEDTPLDELEFCVIAAERTSDINIQRQASKAKAELKRRDREFEMAMFNAKSAERVKAQKIQAAQAASPESTVASRRSAMTEITERFDPWGPISTVLYETGSSDFVQDAIGNTGLNIAWRPLTKNEKYSHSTRIRAFRRDINEAHANLRDDLKGLFAQNVVKALLNRNDGTDIRSRLIDRLSDIGWTISEDGILTTEDALISEQFFPANSEYDAYVTIRDILAKAFTEIVVVDAYIGSSLLQTLRSLTQRDLRVWFLTTEKNLKPDFAVEVATFQKQVGQTKLEIRTTAEFHDRFIVIDGVEFYHVGASIKDAGKRAFMISRMEDQPNIDTLKQSIDRAWTDGNVWQP